MQIWGSVQTYWLTDNEHTVSIDHVAGIALRNPNLVAVSCNTPIWHLRRFHPTHRRHQWHSREPFPVGSTSHPRTTQENLSCHQRRTPVPRQTVFALFSYTFLSRSFCGTPLPSSTIQVA
jgi:hypothetical protein